MTLASKQWVKSLLSRLNIGKYSTDEIRIGTWIDGKPIYRIVGHFNCPIGNGETFIPEMVSANSPSPYKITDNTNGNSWYAYNSKLYSNGDSYWLASNSSMPAWTMIDLGEPKKFASITLYSIGASYADRTPRVFEVQGSNDGEIFVTLLSVKNAYIERNETFNFDFYEEYRYYRLYVTENNGNSSYLSIDKIVYNFAGEEYIKDFDKMINSYETSIKGLFVNEYTKNTD